MKLGLIVNPIAGMGGAVGLKGTDGTEIVREAVRRGATPRAPDRAAQALVAARDSLVGAEILTCSGPMGEDEANTAGLRATVVGPAHAGASSADDTRAAARLMRAAGADLLLFAGGDGTARDVLEAVGTGMPVLGIPAGVKLHSGVFAASPRAAGEIVSRLARGHRIPLREAEVMDIDEEAYRAGRVSARLFGYLRVPYVERAVQLPKARSVPEAGASGSVARAVAALMVDSATLWIVGPGTTTRAVMAELGLEGSLLGVDVVRGRAMLARDADEATLLRLVKDAPAASAARIVVTPIGGQGYIFGRGNHQISARVLAAVGRGGIVVIATPSKLFGLRGAPLLVDTDDDEVNRDLQGYVRVITGVGQEVVYPVGT